MAQSEFLPQAEFRYRERRDAWRATGLSVRAAAALAASACDTIEDARRLGPDFFVRRQNVGKGTFAEIKRLAGWASKPQTALDIIGCALRLGLGAAEAKEAAVDVVAALRRNGLIITTTRRTVRS